MRKIWEVRGNKTMGYRWIILKSLVDKVWEGLLKVGLFVLFLQNTAPGSEEELYMFTQSMRPGLRTSAKEGFLIWFLQMETHAQNMIIWNIRRKIWVIKRHPKRVSRGEAVRRLTSKKEEAGAVNLLSVENKLHWVSYLQFQHGSPGDLYKAFRTQYWLTWGMQSMDANNLSWGQHEIIDLGEKSLHLFTKFSFGIYHPPDVMLGVKYNVKYNTFNSMPLYSL